MSNISQQSKTDKQIEAVNKLVKLFIESYEDPINRPQKKTEDLKEFDKKLRQILGDCGGSLDAYWFIRFFYQIKSVTDNAIDVAILLSQTIKPDSLSDYVDESLIHGAKQALGYASVERAKKGGVGAAQTFNKSFKEPAKKEWERWRKGERNMQNDRGHDKKFDAYGGKTAFADTMVREIKANSRDVAKTWDREWRKSIDSA